MRYSSTLSALAFALVLAGCGKTSLIGRGYSSFKEPYKSEAGLKAAPSATVTAPPITSRS